ncbi:MAG: RluA family pseudouridine synthase [Pseudomonadota bacterium]
MARIQQQFEVGEQTANRRFDQAAAELFSQYSRALLQRWIKEGALTVNGAAARPRDKVAAGDVLSIDVLVEADDKLIAQDVPFDVEFEDHDILVVNKPPGVVVHPGAGNKTLTLINGLVGHDRTLAKLPRAGLIHRIDKNTSGLLLVAKTLDVHRQLVSEMAARNIKRRYSAITNGVPVSGATINQPIGRDTRNRKKQRVTESGRPAITRFRIEKKFRAHALLQIELETGRTHQIRVHLAHYGYPLVGDKQYGAKLHLPRSPLSALRDGLESFSRQALHARELAFTHPTSAAPMCFETRLPDDMAELLSLLDEDAEINA